MTSGPQSVLVISPAPDERPSTTTLRVIIDELASRPDLEVTVWLLRATPQQEVWPGALVVDSLREWPPAVAAERVGLGRVASALRGLRLRAWNRAVHPDIVLLDDGVGERVLVGTPGHPVRVARFNETPPEHLDWEPRPLAAPDVALVPPGAAAEVGRSAPIVIPSPHVRDYSEARRVAADAERRRTREVLGLDRDAPLICGWGSDGWIDGPDLFVRALWSLEQHHGVAAHGLWLGLGADPHEVDRLRVEAARCGVGDRFACRPGDTPAARLCGDAAFLPYRSPGDPSELLEAVSGGLEVVTFPTAPVVDPQVVEVDHLDVDAAATALAAALGGDRPALVEAARERLDVGPWVDRVLAAARERR